MMEVQLSAGRLRPEEVGTQKVRLQIDIMVQSVAAGINHHDPGTVQLAADQDSCGLSGHGVPEAPPVAVSAVNAPDSDQDGLVDTLEEGLGTNLLSEDSDGDGFTDYNEVAGGYNPIGDGVQSIDLKFAKARAGRILIQVERNGEAWYIFPVNLKRYYLGRPADAFNIMRELGLGITNKDLANIQRGN